MPQTLTQQSFFRGFITMLQATVLFLALFSVLSPIFSHAQTRNLEIAPQACQYKKKITFTSILKPTNFTPIIPKECATEADGSARPLTFAVLPDILIRTFGFLASLVFYLFGFIVIFSGIQWMYGGIDGKQDLQAKRNIQDAVWGLILVLGVYMIINTILNVLGVSQYGSTDIASFFTF
jgi:hypothetical protein